MLKLYWTLSFFTLCALANANTHSEIDCNVVRGKLSDQFAVYVFFTPDQKTGGEFKLFALEPGKPKSEEKLVYEAKVNRKNRLGGIQDELKFEIKRKDFSLPEGVRKISYRCEFHSNTKGGDAFNLTTDMETKIAVGEQDLTHKLNNFPSGYHSPQANEVWVPYATNRTDGYILDGKSGVERFDHYIYPVGFRNPLNLLSFGFAKVRLHSEPPASPEMIAFEERGDQFYVDQYSKVKHLVIYVHGYNNNFPWALYQAAKLKQVLGATLNPSDLEVIAFSWPSKGHAESYSGDELSSRASVQALETLLLKLHQIPGDFRIHFIAHSMGGRVTMNSLYEILSRLKSNQDGARIDNLVFAAPDVASYRFALQAISLEPYVKRITLYRSHKDVPLRLSSSKLAPHVSEEPDVAIWKSEKERLALWEKYQLPQDLKSYGRAGFSPLRLSFVECIDSDKVNFKEIPGNEWQHTYFLYADRVLKDIEQIIVKDAGAAQRKELMRVEKNWCFR